MGLELKNTRYMTCFIGRCDLAFRMTVAVETVASALVAALVHFAAEMWEKRTDMRKLKPNAIPTIFVLTENKININIKSAELYQSVNDIQLDEHVGDVQKQEFQPVDDIQLDEHVGNVQKQEFQAINNILGSAETYQPVDDIQLDEHGDVRKQELQVIDNACELSTISSPSCSTECKEKQEKRYKKLKDFIRKQQINIVQMRRKMKALRFSLHAYQNKESDKKNDKYKNALKSIFTECQIKALLKKNRNNHVWSHEIIEYALQLKFICDANGYMALLRRGLPLPSIRTLQRKLQDFQFEPGISEVLFEFLKNKKAYLKNENDIECGLVFDEMSITSKKSYNPSTGSEIGNITFPNDNGIATHAIVFMLVDISDRWKHVVGHHFTGNKFNSNVLKKIIFQIINKAERIGYHVNFITSDMGLGNIGL
ncbi:uncharacterized protein LOC113005416 [Solenopsis invicta]|uniref:uncharacterized protein LOC113005416 n=1 Tax=Solenopsis invicta TaxID=13686 RepID=UPI00193DB51A|nr:uncharacterized protein LOC113005416 [Solenopsis invicta]